MSVTRPDAQAHARRDAARPAEREGAELQHGQAVDLADLRAFGIDQHDAAVDGLLRPVAQAVGALDLLVDGAASRPAGVVILRLAWPDQ